MQGQIQTNEVSTFSENTLDISFANGLKLYLNHDMAGWI